MPTPDWLELKLTDGYVALVTNDGSPTALEVTRSLTQQGWKVVILSFPTSVVPRSVPLPNDINQIELSELSEEHLKQQLATAASLYGPIGAFIHIHPVFQTELSKGISYPDADKAIVKQVFLMAKHLKPSLTTAAKAEHGCFFTVVRLDGAFGLEQQLNFSAIGAGLFGLTKSLDQEWEPVFCRAIDLHPELDSFRSTQCILSELHDPNRRIAEVGYGFQGRLTLTID